MRILCLRALTGTILALGGYAQTTDAYQSTKSLVYQLAETDTKKGRLLTAADSKAARKELIADWRSSQRTAPPTALFVNLPQPD